MYHKFFPAIMIYINRFWWESINLYHAWIKLLVISFMKKAPCGFRIGFFYWKTGKMLDGEVFANDLVGELGHGARCWYGTAFEDRKIITELFAEIEIVLNEQDAHAIFIAQ